MRATRPSEARVFKVSARTLLHLGAELISSDAVAFYELVKNAFDAKSKGALIEVVSRIDFDDLESLRDLIHEERTKLYARKKQPSQDELDALLDGLRANLELNAEDLELEELTDAIENARTLEELEHQLDEANYIIITDEGDGMTLQDLRDVYLTIGTPVRLKQREMQGESEGRPILGEKGIGRLSVMRLGWKVGIESTKQGTPHWNTLEIDWRQFKDLDKNVEEIIITPERGKKKKDPGIQGTKIRISALAAPWSKEKLMDVVKLELARFMDPFAKKQPFQMTLRYNGILVDVPRMQELLFSHAHMKLEGVYLVTEGVPRLECSLTMKERKKDRVVAGSTKIFRTADQLRSFTNTTDKVLRDLGPFKFVLYWFNRKILTQIDGIGNLDTVRSVLRQWAGIMLFRDGFRIHPYGNENDDWLRFDKTALGRGGYKLNKAQFIGKIDIARAANPYLIDQSNREGLKDTREKEALIGIMFHLVQHEVYRIVTQWEKEGRKVEPPQVIGEQLASVNRATEKLVADIEKLDQVQGGNGTIKQLATSLRQQVQAALMNAAAFVDEARDERETLFHLAGIGLMLEVVAHELKRATTRALSTVTKLTKSDKTTQQVSEKSRGLLLTLESQLKTLEKRVRMLDPHSTSARQRKETFDVITWTHYVLDSHADEFARSKITSECVVVGGGAKQAAAWPVHMVKGTYIQILENLINNSIYWLENRKSADKTFKPKLRIELNPQARTIMVIDNGPGIPVEQGDVVFDPFFTTRPHGESRGLGLYIARENARYNDLELELSEIPVMRKGRYNAFLLSWKDEGKA